MNKRKPSKVDSSPEQPAQIEGPVTAALRIGGCAMVCAIHPDGTEFGYPLDAHQRVRRSTGVVRNDDTFTPPTCDYWLVNDDSTFSPITKQEVMKWDVAMAWKYRMNIAFDIYKRHASYCVFSLPCGAFGSFHVLYKGTTPVPNSVRIFVGNSERELATVHCSHAATKDTGKSNE